RLVDPNASVASLLKADLEAGLQACMTATTQYPSEMRFVRQLQAVQEQRVVQRALGSNQAELSSTYLLLYPGGRFIDDVKAHVAALNAVPGGKSTQELPVKVPEPPPPAPSIVPQADVGRVLQTELKRVGCDPDTVDGTWGPASVRAMKTYNRISHTALEISKPTLEALEIIRSKRDRVCPIECKTLERLVGNKCILITCNSGNRLNKFGKCVPIPVVQHISINHSIPRNQAQEHIKKSLSRPRSKTYAEVPRANLRSNTGPATMPDLRCLTSSLGGSQTCN
ncbi:hypothetical protein SAMN04488144_1451, partial [Methylobacterium sp. 190mf]